MYLPLSAHLIKYPSAICNSYQFYILTDKLFRDKTTTTTPIYIIYSFLFILFVLFSLTIINLIILFILSLKIALLASSFYCIFLNSYYQSKISEIINKLDYSCKYPVGRVTSIYLFNLFQIIHQTHNKRTSQGFSFGYFVSSSKDG